MSQRLQSILAFGMSVFLFTEAVTVSAEGVPDYPYATILYNETGQRNAVQVDCARGSDSSEIVCTFYQMSISYELEPERLDDSIKLELKRMEEGPNKLDEKELKTFKSNCLKTIPTKEELDVQLAEMGEGKKKDDTLKVLALYKEVCAAKTVGQAKSAMTRMVRWQKQLETVTCKIWPHVWREIFYYKESADGGYWYSKQEPYGECGVINVSTFRKTDEYFWRYESTRVVTNKEGASGALPCDKLEDRKSVFGWKQSTHEMKCLEVKFGF